jgi:hypothetical protein
MMAETTPMWTARADEESTTTTFGGASCACGTTGGPAQGWRRTITVIVCRAW